MQDGWCMRGTLKFQVCDILAGFCIFFVGCRDVWFQPAAFLEVSAMSISDQEPSAIEEVVRGQVEQTRMRAGCDTMGS